MATLLALLTLSLTLLSPPFTTAHGTHTDQAPLTDPWATRHMASEHHISNFDAASFFLLHDFNSDGVWDPSEIKRTYGLEDETAKDVGAEKREEVVRRVLEVWDADGDGFVDRDEWTAGVGKGLELEDFGVSFAGRACGWEWGWVWGCARC